jgi:outer membrane protein OmpA-like peptidoglycan-associated protein
MSHRDDRKRPVRRARFAAAFVVLACTAMGLPTSPSDAQQRFAMPRNSSVTIDYGVLESLGPEPTVPQVLMPTLPRPQYPIGSTRAPAGRAMPAERIVLRPPGSRSSAPRSTTRTAPPLRRAAPPRQIVRAPTPKPASPASATPTAPSAPPTTIARRAVPPPPVTTAPPQSAPSVPEVPRAASRVPPAPDIVARTPPPPVPSSAAPAPAASAAPAPPTATSPPTAIAPPRQTASLTPSDQGFGVGRSYRLAFASGESKLDDASTAMLEEIAEGAQADSDIRLKLLAYAGAEGQTASQSRRLSLSRALAVRSYLIDKGVRSVQFEVQAKGNKLDGGPPDRVDVQVIKR